MCILRGILVMPAGTEDGGEAPLRVSIRGKTQLREPKGLNPGLVECRQSDLL